MTESHKISDGGGGGVNHLPSKAGAPGFLCVVAPRANTDRAPPNPGPTGSGEKGVNTMVGGGGASLPREGEGRGKSTR